MDGFFVAYEYGTGAAWAFIKAERAGDVRAELPEVDVYETPPRWMTVEDLHRVREHAYVELNRESNLDTVLEASRRLLAAAS
jgi:hypothetical protein